MQNRAIFTFSSALFLALGLSGCNSNVGTNQYNDNLSPVGYYSNENIKDGQIGNTHNDNDGPITEMMDRNAANHDLNQNNTLPLVNKNNVVNDGNLNNNYDNTEDALLAKSLALRATKVKNVNDARAVIRGNDVLIAVDTHHNQKGLTDQVKKAVQPLAKGKNIYVVSDKNTFQRVQNFDNNLRNGNTIDQINNNLNDLFQSIGNKIDNPFKKNQ